MVDTVRKKVVVCEEVERKMAQFGRFIRADLASDFFWCLLEILAWSATVSSGHFEQIDLHARFDLTTMEKAFPLFTLGTRRSPSCRSGWSGHHFRGCRPRLDLTTRVLEAQANSHSGRKCESPLNKTSFGSQPDRTRFFTTIISLETPHPRRYQTKMMLQSSRIALRGASAMKRSAARAFSTSMVQNKDVQNITV